MFKFFKRKPKDKSCVNCVYYKKGKSGERPKCTKTRNSTLKNFPFVNTKCQTYQEK